MTHAGRRDHRTPIVIRGREDRRRLERDLFSPERELPIVFVTGANSKPILPFDALAAAIQSEYLCWFCPIAEVVEELNGTLGRRLRVPPEAIRIFWPKLNRADDPAAHPLIEVLPCDPVSAAAEAVGYAFDLSRPRVRYARDLQREGDALASSLAEAVRRTSQASQASCGNRLRGSVRKPVNARTPPRRRPRRR